jgi:hypothetical protein
MSQLSLELLEISDEQALTSIEQVGRSIEALNLSVRCQVFDAEPGRSIPIAEVRNNPEVASVLSMQGFLFRAVGFDFGIPNGGGNGSLNFTRQPSGIAVASISLAGPLDNDAARRTRIAVAFNNAFGQFHRRKIFAQLPAEIADFYVRRESTLVRLEEIATRAAENTEAHRRLLDEQFEVRRRELQTQYDGRLEQFRIESEGRVESLDEREKALVQREADLEKADNTHARRKLRQDLKSVLKARHDKFTLTKETEDKRRPVSWVFLTLMSVTIAASVYFGWLASQAVPPGMMPWFPSVRLGLSLAGFAGTAIYFIRWQDRWSQVHADEEFRLKRLDLDVDRASWLVEVLLEWRGAADSEIPQELIDKLANGLFDSGRPYPSATHPVEDAIASLLAAPASLKLRLPGGEVNLDKKAIDRAKSANDS